ncbi:hypothetical protein SEUCBS139899_007306 [Sporothrix eucalyptigena]|uniref:Thioredoxin-like protein AAED1 n=1 Tax=Sporothrix eucalyptigena TaxID=1812306 RepID=A0ABP0C4B1_9PEZI
MTTSSDAAPAAVAVPADNDKVNPVDFSGSVRTDNKIPSKDTLKRVADMPILDREGKTHTFKSLYEEHIGRTLILFVRHFFCGNCQEYLRILSQAIPPAALINAPTPTQIIVVGCGDPSLIDLYLEASSCAYPVYADPTRRLYDELGMVSTLALGSAPGYMKHTNIWSSSWKSFIQSVKQIPKGMALKGGNQRQVGGEFLFENKGDGSDVPVTWCHRMKNTRDHAEIEDVQDLLGLEKTEPEAASVKVADAQTKDAAPTPTAAE